MKYDLLLIRHGELSLKTKWVRKQFESTLVRNIKHAFTTHNLSCTVEKEWGRIYLYTDKIQEGKELLQRIFGVTSVSPVKKTTAEMDKISKLVVPFTKELLKKGDSFALRVTRTGRHRFTSQNVAIKIGDDIRTATGAPVDLTHPDVEIYIEIRNENAFLFVEKYRGTGGLPLGTQGKVVALIDSPQSLLASWYLMRRGCEILFVTLNEQYIGVLEDFMSYWNAQSEVCSLPGGKQFYEKVNAITLKHRGDAIVTGHTIYSSAALTDIKQLKKHVSYPVLSPLIALEMNEIQSQCNEAGIPI